MDTNIENNLPEFIEFYEKYFLIYPQGNKDDAYNAVLGILKDKTNRIRDHEGILRPVTFKDIYTRYKQYCDNWDDLYSEKQARGYLNSSNEKADPHSFIYRGLWESEFTQVEKNPLRSLYLFGKDKKKLKREYNYFKNFILSRKSVPIINDIVTKEKEIEPKIEINNTKPINDETLEIKPSENSTIDLDIFEDEESISDRNNKDFLESNNDNPF